MNIFVPKFNIKIVGNVHLQIRDGDGAIKQDEKYRNAIHDDLINAIVTHMGASSGSTAYHITKDSGWFTTAYGMQTGKDGIIISQTSGDAVKTYDDGIGNDCYDLKLSEATSEGASTGVCSWTAEGTWTGASGSGTATSGTFDEMRIGNSFEFTGGETSEFSTNFATAESSGDFTGFTLDDNDVCRVTWTLSVPA
jgi:hypothetical protein